MRQRAKPTEAGSDAASSAASPTRGLEILPAFTIDDASPGNRELIARTGLPKAKVSRLTSARVGLGYLHCDAVLGRTGAAVAPGTRDGLEMVCLANCRPMGPVSLRLNVGARVPVRRTAMGLACLAGMRSELRESLLRHLMLAEPDRAEEIRARVAEAVESLARRGFGGVFGRWYGYIDAVGVTFRPTDGSPPVALTCGGVVDILPRETCLETVGLELVRLTRRLGARLAGQPDTDPPPPDWKTTVE